MLSADAYRSAMTAVAADLKHRFADLPDANLQIESDRDRWRIGLSPESRAACAFEAVIRSDGTMDCNIGDVSREGVALRNPRELVPLLTAIRDGQVTLLSWSHPASGRRLGSQVVVTSSESDIWVMGDASADDQDHGLCAARHFAPYERGA